MQALRLTENGLETLTEDERRALRASKFSGLSTSQEPSRPPSRIAHPGGALATNKAAALARFLKRKIEAGNVATLDPNLVEMAVRNAQASLTPDSQQGMQIKHVESFEDEEAEEVELLIQPKGKKCNKKHRIEQFQGVAQAAAVKGCSQAQKKNKKKKKNKHIF